MSGAEDSGSLGMEGGKRGRLAPPSGPLVCLIEGCGVDLTGAKDYHQRHKVCEHHARAATVMHKGQVMRFCQQCSRFHLLAEFDEGKRSCRRRLLGHNKRRRKKEEATSESEQIAPPALQSPSLAAALNEYDIRDDVRRRITASLLADHLSMDRSPALQMGRGLSLNSTLSAQQSPPGGPAQPAGDSRTSLAISQLLQRNAQESALSSLLLATSQPQSSELLGRSLGLSPSQQLLLRFPTQGQPEQAPKPEEQASLLQLHFPDIAGTRQSPSLQQLLDKPSQTWASSSHQTIPPMSAPSALFPFPSSLQLLQSPPLAVQPTPNWTARPLDALEESPKGAHPALHLPRSYSASDRTGRISFKLFDKSPSELPLELRDQILDWLQRRPAAVETYLRPGCVHVSAFLAMSEEDWTQLEAGLPERLHALLQDPTTSAWTGGSFLAFVRDSVAWVERGVVQRVSPLLCTSSPVLVSVHPRWAVPGRPLEMTITGRGLLHADNRILCLHRGQRLLDCRVSVPASHAGAAERPLQLAVDLVPEQDAPTPAGGLQWSPCVGGGQTRTAVWRRHMGSGQETLQFKLHLLPKQSMGTVWVELDRCGVPSAMRPLVLADAAVCAELAQLEAELQETPESRDSKAADLMLEAFPTDVGWLLGATGDGTHAGMLVDREWGRHVLEFALSRGLVHTTQRLLQAMAAMSNLVAAKPDGTGEGVHPIRRSTTEAEGATQHVRLTDGLLGGAWLGESAEDAPRQAQCGHLDVQSPGLPRCDGGPAAEVPVAGSGPHRPTGPGSIGCVGSGPWVAREGAMRRHYGLTQKREEELGQLFPWHVAEREVGCISWIADPSTTEVW